MGSFRSLSARRAWIEMPKIGLMLVVSLVVALRKESVDRNLLGACLGCNVGVALRKESVDRNSWAARARVAQYWSLSARRAWIEILS